ncbi:hypothetical protein AncyloWKF20_09385 [Ancylobacter sp. WKF20]|uniref:hypothetical protein n=1 Tax=Ancylobacter sp. WKF20 TaxID=3039801 RepID=UPI0024345E42|nr:hypothetical protein [Ancylobacter sp. WKF20]WGD32007.1 hypothetical protein AncyloWKF20_09385 [Ancylobacter sp. WKF20]
MSYVEWPSSLPYASAAADWQLQPFRPFRQTTMEGGNVRNRRRPGDDVATMRWSRIFKEGEMEAFEAFVAETAGLSARWVMPVSVNGSTYERRLVQLSGDPPEYTSPATGITRVSMTLIVFPPEMTPAFESALDFSVADNSQLFPIFF